MPQHEIGQITLQDKPSDIPKETKPTDGSTRAFFLEDHAPDPTS